MGLQRSRLTQERWFTLVRWLLIQTFLYQVVVAGKLQLPAPPTSLERIVEAHQAFLFLGFASYTLLVTLLVFTRRSWPTAFAYATASIDLIVAVLATAIWSEGILNPGFAAVAASAIAAGIRRFPLFETCVFVFLIAVGLSAARFLVTRQVSYEVFDILTIATAALLPLLARASSLAPQQDEAEQAVAAVAARALRSLETLGEMDDEEEILHRGASLLAQYSQSQMAATLRGSPDGTIDIATVVGDSRTVDRLPPQRETQLAARLLAVKEATTFGRGDDLNTGGLPDLYPPRLDQALAAPIPDIAEGGAALFAANRRGGPYAPDDVLMATALAREVSRLVLSHRFAAHSTEARLATIEGLLAAMEAKTPDSRARLERCGRIAVAISTQLGWDPGAIEDLRTGTLLHHVGELAVPDSILEKRGELTAQERELMEAHPRIGAKIIDAFNRSEVVLDAVFAHHERWDGRGYPRGLAGESIPMAGRIVAVADAVEAAARGGAEGGATAPSEVLQEIIGGSGTRFDPSVVQALMAVLREEGEDFLQRAPEPPMRATETGRYRV